MNKQKNILLAGTSLLLATNLVFGSGFYVSAALQGVMQNSDFKVYSPSTQTIFKRDLSNGSLLGNFAVGYGYVMPNNLYLGGELIGSIGKISTDVIRQGVLYKDQIFINRICRQDYAALDFTPGYKVNDDLLFYTRLGLVGGKLSISQNSVPGVVGFDNSVNKIGYRCGLGFDYTISKIAIGADYIYSFYTSFETLSPRGTSYRVIPRSNVLGIHIKYNI